MREFTSDVAQIGKVLRSAVLPATFAPARLPPVAIGELPPSVPPPPADPARIPPMRGEGPLAPAPLPRISIDLPVTPTIPGATSQPSEPAAMNVGRFATLLRTPAINPDLPFGRARE